MEQLQRFLEAAVLYVRQKKEWAEIVIDLETVNKYEVLDESGAQVGFILEKGGGITAWLKRVILRSHRPFEVDVLDGSSSGMLRLTRSFFFFFSDLSVLTPEGERLGSVHRRFGIIYKKYDLKDSTGQIFARIQSPFWRLWTFPIRTAHGTEAGSIAKRWGGGLREIFTDADTFRIDFSQADWTLAQRAVIFAAAVSVDFDFFENNQGSGGLLDVIPG